MIIEIGTQDGASYPINSNSAEMPEVLPLSVVPNDDSGRQMMIFVSHEGIIMDVYEDDVQLGTAGKMYNEWADWVLDVG